MKIVKKYPPNFKEIVAAFPKARGQGTVFCYGDTIYAPTSKQVDKYIIAHEAVHSERQLSIGVELWWRHYINNRQFRYEEELLAHVAEYKTMIADGIGERRAIFVVADRLGSKLYGCGGGFEQARKDILKAAA